MVDFKLDFKDLSEKLEELQDKSRINRIVKKALKRVVDQIQEDVAEFTPRGKGDLFDSWRLEETDDLSIEAGFDIIYAQYQHEGQREDGTHKIQNRPAGGESFFLKKTLEENMNKYLELYSEVVFEELFTL